MRRLALLTLSTGLAFAQAQLPVDKLVEFVKSSITMKQPDKQVAEYLKRVKLNYQLEERVIEDLQGLGAGPRTLEALRQLRMDSLNLPQPPAPVQKRVIAPLAGPNAAEQAKIIAATREYALTYTKGLPNYMCLQVTRRFADPTGTEVWHRLDTIVTRVSFNNDHEDYKVLLVNNTPVNFTSIEQAGGTTTSGEFGTQLKELFEPASRAEFTWERWATLRGRRTHVFAYRVPREHSKFSLSYERKETITTGYRGLVYVDRDIGSVMRITQEPEGIPPGFPINSAHTVLDYDLQDLSGQAFILPLRSETRMRTARYLTRNETEFRKYQKFSADVEIQFDTDDTAPLPDDKKQETPPKP